MEPQIDFELHYKKFSPTAVAPQKAHNFDLGWDLFALEDVIIPAYGRKLVRTGIGFRFPPGVGGILKDRSSVASKQGLFIQAGVIDSGYRGEVQVLMFNSNRQPAPVKAGSKIAQMILMPIFNVTEFKEVQTLEPSERGEGGFGSTGE